MDFQEFRQLEDETKAEIDRLQTRLNDAFYELCASLNLKVGEKIFFRNEYYFVQKLEICGNFNSVVRKNVSSFIWVTLIKPTKTGQRPIKGSTILVKSTEISRWIIEQTEK